MKNIKCNQCKEMGISYNEDGDWLCEDCLFEGQMQDPFPSIVLIHKGN